MPATMTEWLEQVSSLHFPYPPATSEDIESFEKRVGWRLDPDLRAFYLHCNGAEFFRRLPDTRYLILPLAEIIRARVAILGQDDDACGPATLYALCDVQDGNYVLLDTGQQENGRYPLLDGFHETFPDPAYCVRIASCLSEFLEGVLRSGGRPLYWLGD